MRRSHLKWLILLGLITLCIAMFAWRTLGPRHGETPWGAFTTRPVNGEPVQLVEGQGAPPQPRD